MSEKKKILIVNRNLHIGGVQKALVSLLWNIKDRYDITLLLLYKGGEYLDQLPENINVISTESDFLYLGMTKDDAHNVKDKLGRAFYGGISRIFGRKYAVALMSIGHKKISGFDCAISYMHNAGDKTFFGGCNEFVLRHVEAKKKIAFLHCDYVESAADTKDNDAQFASFDLVAACSRSCAESFLRVNPHMKDRVKVVKNCHSFGRIAKQAEEDPVELKKDKLNIVTVARLSKAKNVDRAVKAMDCLGELKNTFHYFVVGDGICERQLQEEIKERKLESLVTLCGSRTNPYGYIKAADLFLLPSRSEAAPIVYGEAVSLGVPVLSTDTCSAREMVEDTGYGWVCENNVAGLEVWLRKLLSEPELIEEKRKQLQNVKLTDDCAVQQFVSLIE